MDTDTIFCLFLVRICSAICTLLFSGYAIIAVRKDFTLNELLIDLDSHLFTGSSLGLNWLMHRSWLGIDAGFDALHCILYLHLLLFLFFLVEK